VLALARRVFAAISAPFDPDDAVRSVSASVGVALFPDDAGGAEELIAAADAAMYRAKAAGKGRIAGPPRGSGASPSV
jgi:diguanylate cyclase (GGDEF)-like protein